MLEAVLVHAHPKGVPSTVNRFRDEDEDTYQARKRAHRADLLAQRVELHWHA